MPGTVTVACKLPNGIFLRVFDMVETQEPVMGGGYRTVKMAREKGQRVRLNGFSHAQNRAPNSPIREGFALTYGVDKDLWDLWKSQNADTDMVKNGLVFAHEKDANTLAEIREKKDTRSGLERLDPNKLPKGIKKSDMVLA